MNKIYYFIFMFIIFNYTYGQEDVRSGRHIFDFPIELVKCDFAGNVTDTTDVEMMERNWIFTIENITNSSNYVILVSKFKGDDEQNLRTFLNQNGDYIYFKLTKEQYEKSAVRLAKKGKVIIGASTTLFKIRPGNKPKKDEKKIYSEFGNDFNIGTTIGYNVKPSRRYDFSFSFMVGLGFTSIKVTPESVNNFISTESTQSCFTPSFGLLFEYEKFQFSAFSGYDIMFNEIGHHWIYRNRPWLGIGFGYEIFNIKTSLQN